MLLNTEHSHKSKEGRGTESTYITVVVDVGPFEVLVVWHEFQISPVLAIAQSSTNQLALSPSSPARPSNYCSSQRLDLSYMGVVLPDRLLTAAVLCV